MVYDGLVVLAVWLVTLFLLVAMLDHAVTGAFVQSLLFLETFVFFCYFWTRRGQTVGMLAWGLHVETADGTPLGPSRALLRFLGALAAFATLGLGYVWMLFDANRRTWPDLLSGTQLIHTPRR